MTSGITYDSQQSTNVRNFAACPQITSQQSVDYKYVKRQWSGEDGKSQSQVPKVNNYSTTIRSGAFGQISLAFMRRDFSVVPCGGKLLDPYPESCILSLSNSFPGEPGIANRVADAVRSFRSKAYQEAHAFQAGTFIGEFAETAGLILSPFKAITKLTKRYLEKSTAELLDFESRYGRIARNDRGLRLSMKRDKRYNGPSQFKTRDAQKAFMALKDSIGSAWLSYSLGVKPLIADFQNFSKAWFDIKPESQVNVQKVSGKKISESSGTTDDIEIPKSFSNCGWVETSKSRYSSSSRVSGYLVHSVSMSGASRERQSFSLDIDSFIPTLWNLLPYSFIADYFLDVGETLEAQALQASDVQSPYITSKAISETTISASKFPAFRPVNDDDLFDYGPFNVTVSVTPCTLKTIAFVRRRIITDEFSNYTHSVIHRPKVLQQATLAALGNALLTGRQDVLTPTQRSRFGIK